MPPHLAHQSTGTRHLFAMTHLDALQPVLGGDDLGVVRLLQLQPRPYVHLHTEGECIAPQLVHTEKRACSVVGHVLTMTGWLAPPKETPGS